MNVNEQMIAGNVVADANFPDSDPDATQFEYGLCWCCYWFVYQYYVLVLYVKMCSQFNTNWSEKIYVLSIMSLIFLDSLLLYEIEMLLLFAQYIY